AARRLGGRLPRRRAHPFHACRDHGDLRRRGGGADLVIREAPERSRALLARDARLDCGRGWRRRAGAVRGGREPLRPHAWRHARVLLELQTCGGGGGLRPHRGERASVVVGRALSGRRRKIRNTGRRGDDRRYPDSRRSPGDRPARVYRRDPLPVPAEFPGEAGRGARCDHPSHVPGKGPGRVRDRLRAALRAQSLQDARCPDRACCRRLPRLARGGGGRRAARVRPGGQGSPVGLGMEEVRAVSTRAQALAEAAQPIHPPPTSFWRQYVFSIDHKVIAKQFLWAGLLFLLLGGTLAMLIRWQWAFPYRPVPVLGPLFLPETGGASGPATYQQIFTTHGLIMIFFAVTPVLIGCFGNFLIPLMIGARDMAFPKLNMYSFWTFLLSQLLVLASFLADLGSAGAGWTTYPPLSTNVGTPGPGTTLVLAAIFVAGVSSTLGAINYVTTVIRMRAPGMGYMRLPLTMWGLWLTAILNALF